MTKRAVLVGIDDFSDRAIPPLAGCVADAQAIAALLTQRFGFAEADVKLLVGARATKDAILRAIDWLGMTAAPGDTSVLFLATYGSHLPNERGDDRDGLDQVFASYDHHFQLTALRDDEVVTRLRRVPRGATTVVLADVGQACELPTQPGPPAFGAPMPTRGRYLAPPPMMLQAERARGLQVRPRLLVRKGDDAPIVGLLACREGEVAAEIPAGGAMRGAFTLSLTEVLAEAGALPWQELVDKTGERLRARGCSMQPELGAPPELAAAPAFAGGIAVAATGAQPTYGGAPAYPAQSYGGAPQGHGAQPSSGIGAGAIAAGLGVAAVAGGVAAMAYAGSGPSSQLAAPPAPAPLGPMLPTFHPVNTALAEFAPDDYSVKVANAVLFVVPFAPKALSYRTLEEALPQLFPAATAETHRRASLLASSPDVSSALSAVGVADKADTGLAAFSGAKAVWGLITGKRSDALETDTQQGIDAVIKLLAMAYFIAKLYPGGPIDRVRAHHTTPAGQAMTIFYGAIDVALPFADNAVSYGSDLLSGLVSRHGAAATTKLGAVAGPAAASEAQGVLSSLIAPVSGIVQSVLPYAKRAGEAVSTYLPTAMNIADKAAGAVATGIDALPVYRYLGARAAAEACVLLASRG